MDIKQIQKLLNAVGDVRIEEDGIWGPRSQAALDSALLKHGTSSSFDAVVESTFSTDAQQYLQADGYYHIPRGVNVQLSDHLWSHEVACQGSGCCAESVINPSMVDLFEEIRVDYGKPIEIVTAGGSGYRCPQHNADVGGAAGSLHLTGSAFDMHANVIELLPVVLRHLKDGEYGVYSDFIHVGIWHRGYVNRYQ